MNDQKSQTTEVEAGEPRSIAQVIESLLENAAETLTRATDRDNADWQKFHLGIAAAYKELALQLEPIMSVQAQIDEKNGPDQASFPAWTSADAGSERRQTRCPRTGRRGHCAGDDCGFERPQPAAWFRPRCG